ncbi:hypothetical protein GE061_014276 [Apolygus lucorum]|uniref:Uncharacterized protein n=1 Tax=Apolygus lucorum TaxID=248454 RepID=A0A6A4K1Y6_APOLU|nr:hypothetical protein GE061_014276 [Apolygus lucorum]
MKNHQDFAHLEKTIPRKLDVPKITGAMKSQSSFLHSKMSNNSQIEGTPIEVAVRCRTGTKDNTDSGSFVKATAQCHVPNGDFGNFNVNDVKNWGEALPLFDDDDPAEGTDDFDEIVYSRLAKLNKMQKTQKSDEKLHQTRKFISERNFISFEGFLKLFFNLVLLGLFCSILFSVFRN